MASKALVLVLSITGLSACTHRASQPAAGIVPIAHELALVLPRPSELGRAVDSAQLVTARYGEETYVFEGHVTATPERFLMVGLDSLGRKAMTINWTDAALSYEVAPWLPAQLRPENVLADMVMMYWPEAAVRQALSASNGTLLAEPQRRSVMHDGQEIIRIDYASGLDSAGGLRSLRFRNLLWNYQLDVQSTDAAR